jgi:hypothetical protein
MVDNGIIMLTPTAAKETRNLWTTYLDQDPDDKVIGAWTDDANGVLAFVSLNLLVRLFII